MSSREDARLLATLELMARIAAGDYGARGEVSGADDLVDGVVTGLNLLAETFEVEHAQRLRAEGLLEDAIDAYENAPGLFCSVSVPELEIVKVNQTFAEHLGPGGGEIVGRSFSSLFAAESRRSLESILAHVAHGAHTEPIDLRLDGAHGALTVQLQGIRVIEEDGEPRRISLILRDVTAERQLQDQLAHSQKLDAIGQLAGGLAHDLNNILTIIRSAVSFLREDTAGSPHLSDDIDDIDDATRRAAELTSQLLALSRRAAVEREVVEVGPVLRQLSRVLARTWVQTIDIDVDVEKGLAPVSLGKGQLDQVLMNLAVNARDAMQDGGKLSFRARNDTASGEAPTVVVEVTDNGEGMDEELQRRVFEPFFTTKASGDGTGLGLAVCDGIVRQAGGTMKLESKVGVGTTITITLPAAEATKPTWQDSTVPGKTADERILLVDDDVRVRRGVKRILEGAGYIVQQAGDGASARERFGARPDLLLTDVIMKGEGGPDLARWARTQVPDLPILFMTGYSPHDLPMEQLGGVVGIIRKPFDARQLLARIRALLDATVDPDGS